MTIAVQNLAEVIESSLAISAPEFDDVADDLDLIEAELMKKGTLAYFEIDWNSTYEMSLKALGAGAHIDAVAAACTAIIQQAAIEELPQFAKLLTQLLNENWSSIHPTSAKFDRLKKSRVQELLELIPKRLEKEPVQEEGFEETVNALVAAAENLGLDSKSLSALRVQKEQRQAEAGSEGIAAPQQPAVIGGSESTATSGYTSDLDAKGRSQLKRDVIAMAERIEIFRPKDPTPFYLRAFASTIELKTAPESDGNGVTTMNAMPTEIADPFERALNAPNAQVLKQLEQRLLNSPDWFDGQAIAAQLADLLDMPLVSAAIKHRVQNRIKQIPELAELKYSNETPFISAKSQTILFEASSEIGAHNKPSGASDVQPNRIEKIGQIYAESGLASALEFLEKELKKANSERDKAIINLERAAFLADHGFSTLAEESLKLIAISFESEDLQKWDQSLLKRLKELTKIVSGGD